MKADGGTDTPEFAKCPGVDARDDGWLWPGEMAVVAKNVGVGAPRCVKLRCVLDRFRCESGVVGGSP